MAYHNDLGKKGEDTAVAYLIEKEYVILQRNYRYLKAEVDIIAKKGTTLVAVEVKTRANSYFENPQDTVNAKKIKLLVTAMNNYIVDNDLDVELRFDIIAIILNPTTKINHIKDAFLYF